MQRCRFLGRLTGRSTAIHAGLRRRRGRLPLPQPAVVGQHSVVACAVRARRTGVNVTSDPRIAAVGSESGVRPVSWRSSLTAVPLKWQIESKRV